MSVRLVNNTPPRPIARVYRAMCGLLLYLALWGGLCSMAYLSTAGLLPLAPGGVFVLALALAPERRRAFLILLGGGVLLSALLPLLRHETFLDGVKYFLNRLFAASEERQAYEYEYFTLSSPDGLSALRYALFPLGMLGGTLCGFYARYLLKWLLAALFALLCAAAAYLGVSPGALWLILLAFSVILPFSAPSGGGGDKGFAPAALCGALPAVVVCAAVFLAFPGEDALLSAWDETARDVLALETVAYTDEARPDAARRAEQAAEDKQFYQEEETAADTGGEEERFSVPYPILLAILLTALALFVPAVWSDRLKKRRAKNRAGLDDPDNAAAVRAAFLYAMRWFYAGGLLPENLPYGGSAGAVGELFSGALRSEFEEILPLWREAAYSEHPIDETQRARMLAFVGSARTAVWARLGKRERLKVNYVVGL